MAKAESMSRSFVNSYVNVLLPGRKRLDIYPQPFDRMLIRTETRCLNESMSPDEVLLFSHLDGAVGCRLVHEGAAECRRDRFLLSVS